jgi:hypothetical protein
MDLLPIYTEYLRLETMPTFCSHVAIHSYTYEQLRQVAGIHKHSLGTCLHDSTPGLAFAGKLLFFNVSTFIPVSVVQQLLLHLQGADMQRDSPIRARRMVLTVYSELRVGYL